MQQSTIDDTINDTSLFGQGKFIYGTYISYFSLVNMAIGVYEVSSNSMQGLDLRQLSI